MKLGVWTPLPHTIRPEPRMQAAIDQLSSRDGTPEIDSSFRFAADFLQRAEGYGFGISLIAERFLGPDLESWVMASALATATRSIELMVAVHPGIVHPQLAAKMGASLDRISGGRFAVNVVNGWWEQEFEIFGNGGWVKTPEERYQRMNEFMAMMRSLWAEDVVDISGDFFSARNASLPTRAFRQPSPPIYAASQAEAGKDSIAQYADCWFVQQQSSFREFDSALAQATQAVAEMQTRSARFGRSVGIGLSSHVICASTMAEADAIATELEQYGKGGTVSFVAATGLASALVGTPEVIAERLNQYHEAGVQLAMLHFHPMMDGLDRFAAEVMPKLGWDFKAQATANG